MEVLDRAPTALNVCRNLNGFDIEDEPGVIHVIPCSGGADSSALVVFLHRAFPHIKFRIMFTDTMAEPASTYEFLDVVEKYVGNKIERILPEDGLGLFELVEKYNGYMPSGQARWCTRQLKLIPFQKWMKQFNGQSLCMYVGLRADEPTRVAFDIPGVETILPFVEMGWDRAKVFNYLSETVGIPRTYLSRTRSGCTTCPFTRKIETISLYQYQKVEFLRGMKYEKLTDSDKDRHTPGVELWKDSGISLNWLSLPMPEDGSVMQGGRAKKDDLFGSRGLFAAGEFFMTGMPGFESFCWQQRFISYSTSLNGIKKQINGRYDHLLQTAEVHELTPEDIRRDVRFAVWYVEFPSDVFDPDGPRGKSYTWQQGSSYSQIQHCTDFLTRALQAESLRKQAAETSHHPLSVQYEWASCAVDAMERAESSGRSLGHVVDSMWYVPVENEKPESEEEETSLTPCPMCSI